MSTVHIVQAITLINRISGGHMWVAKLQQIFVLYCIDIFCLIVYVCVYLYIYILNNTVFVIVVICPSSGEKM